jgi:hypothetical protein
MRVILVVLLSLFIGSCKLPVERESLYEENCAELQTYFSQHSALICLHGKTYLAYFVDGHPSWQKALILIGDPCK